MKQLVLVGCLLVGSCQVWAQKPTLTYRDTKDSSANYYLTVNPIGTPKGLLILLPGYGESPEYVYAETDLPKQAARQGLLTVIATLQRGGETFYVDDASQQALDSLILAVQSRYKLTGKKLYLGGFSLGGSGVVRYAERAAMLDKLPHPNAVFAIDPPLDFRRLYQSSERNRTNKIAMAANEAVFLIDRMNQEFGGSPAEKPARYTDLSPYCYSDTTNRQAATLKNTPIRLISEPAILWQIRERNRGLYDLNTTDCIELINYLQAAGNRAASYVLTADKGYRRQQQKRHPHAWSIADPKTTVDWLLKH